MSDPAFDIYHPRRRAALASDERSAQRHRSEPRARLGSAEALACAIEQLLIAKGHCTSDEVARVIDLFDNEYPFRGSRVVARAWVDPDFKRLLIQDGKGACAEMGIDLETEYLMAVENTPELHNVVVCTLCSCYPRRLMGIPPTWYKGDNYRARMVADPRSVLAEFGTIIPDEVAVRVHDSTAEMRYVVIPQRPEGTENWTETELSSILTRDTLVGVSLPDPSSRV